MIKTTDELYIELKDYSNKKTKIERMVKNNSLYKIKNGLYETNSNINPFFLSSIIYGPSYISFQTALYFYNLIPECVYIITSATTLKRKKKEYKNHFGLFTYRDVPNDVFPYGIEYISNNEYTYYIATKEKAITDMLYIYHPVDNIKELKDLLFDDLRIDEELFKTLDFNLLINLSEKYKTKNHDIFIKFIRRYYVGKQNIKSRII